MGYVLLWIENLAVSLLLVAALLACIARLRRPAVRVLLSMKLVVLLLAVYAGLTGLAAYLQFGILASDSWFYPILALTLGYAVGAIWILARGLRCVEGEARPAAASWSRGKLAIALAVAVALHVMTFWNLDLAMRQHLVGLQTEAGAVAMSCMPTRIPDGDNAARIYEKAFEAMEQTHQRRPEWDESWLKVWEEKWEYWNDTGEIGFDPQDPQLREFLQGQAPALALLREAAEKPGCFFDRDYGRPRLDMLLPEIPPLRTAARLLALDARCQAADGNLAEALKDVNALFRVAEHFGSDPILVSVMVSKSIDALAVHSLQYVLASGQATVAEVAAVNIDEGVSYRRWVGRGFRMEEALGLTVFCQMGSQFDLALLDGDRSGGVRGMAPLYRIFLLSDDLAAHRRVTSRLRALAIRPYYQARTGWEDLVEEMRACPRGVLTAALVPALTRCAEAAAQGDARRRVARLGLAAYRYRAGHGRFPDKLEELTPELITVVPRDPFDGEPIRLRRTNGCLVIYSIGPDMADNGGTRLNREKKTGDITFELVDRQEEVRKDRTEDPGSNLPSAPGSAGGNRRIAS